MKKNKTVLVVDDSEIDRTILKTILCEEFEVIEKDSGFMAIDYLTKNSSDVDVMLLDVSMPTVDGFDVLQFMKEADINLPVFLVTVEATKDNVEKAAQYGVVEFMRKPFEREDIIRRIKMRLGCFTEYVLSSDELWETRRYISELESIYKRYLNNFGQDQRRYQRISDLMRIMLERYSTEKRRMDPAHIEVISKAGYFCDIGNMVVPPEMIKIIGAKGTERDNYHYHSMLGAKLVSLNQSERCRYFVEVCSDICLHHHDRYDAKRHSLVYSQLCRLASQFDSAFVRYRESGDKQFDVVVHELQKDEGNVSRDIFDMLVISRFQIIQYYRMAEA